MSLINELKNIAKPSSQQTILFKYTEKLDDADYTHIIDSINDENKFYLSSPQKPSYIGIGECIKINPKNKEDILKAQKKIAQDYHIISNTNNHIKFFGGLSFNYTSKRRHPWHKTPKNYFTIPKFLISFNTKKTTLTSFFIINSNVKISEINNEYSIFKKMLNQPKIDTLISPEINEIKNTNDKKDYSQLFRNYKKKISNHEINKIILARMKTFSNKNYLYKKTIINKMDYRCTNFLFQFNQNNTLIGSTPELLIDKKGIDVLTEALAGSISKSNNIDKNKLKEQLMTDKKELAEHEFVIQHIEKKLNYYIKNLTLSKTQIKTLEHIYHLHTPIKGTLKSNTNIIELLFNLHPTPAVLGLPEKECSKIINDNEPFDRGWYSGCIGWFDLKGDGRFDVAIRSGLISENRIYLFSGGGIVQESIENNEWNETESKFQHLLSKLN